MTIQARADGVHIEEQATVGHLTQVHEMNLNTRGSQDRQGGAHRGVDLARDHNKARARADGRGH